MTRGNVGCMGGLGGLECPETRFNPVVFYSCVKASVFLAYPSEPRPPDRVHAIEHVQSMRDIAQIISSVVQLRSVHVVDLISGPRAIHVEPSESMPAVLPVVDPYDPVAVNAVVAACWPIDLNASSALNPMEFARLRIVAKDFFQTLQRQITILLAHAVAPVERWFGKCGAGVGAPVPCEFYYVGGGNGCC